jgi:ribonuclease HII
MLIAGIDEAGRGPLIGSLFIAGVLIEKDYEEKLKAIGVKDSKLLTEPQRERIRNEMMPLIKKFKLIEVSPEEIDDAVEPKDPKMKKAFNLNWLEADKTIEILAELKPEVAYVDCPSTNTKAYTFYLQKGLAEKGINKIKLVVEHKADVNYPCSSAASIIAKVAREDHIIKLKKQIGINFGSGYPSDPITQQFLAKSWSKHPYMFRKSWSSYKKVAEAKKQRSLGDF